MASRLLTLDNIRNAKEALRKDGHLRIEQAYSPAACREFIEIIDAHVPEDHTEVNYSNTETRIWDAEKKHPAFRAFYDECNIFTAAMTGTDVEAKTLLAIRNRSLDPTDQKSRSGRWHIDSFRRQLKIFLFLTDTTEQSGPFEFVPRTQVPGFKATMICKGVYFKPGDFLSKDRHRAYQKIDDSVVAELARSGFKSVPFICGAGTALVINTSAIHRARPCTSGARYALTTYCRAR